MTIHAYTESDCTYPAYVNLTEESSDEDSLSAFVLTVRSNGASGSSSIRLTRQQLLNLVNDASVYLVGDYDQLNKNEAMRANHDQEAEFRRFQALEQALRTPGVTSYQGVLTAAKAYQAHIEGAPQPATIETQTYADGTTATGTAPLPNVSPADEGNAVPSAREQALEELVRSACAIAERQGAETAWSRFVASVQSVGLNGVTARTYRVLPSDFSGLPG